VRRARLRPVSWHADRMLYTLGIWTVKPGHEESFVAGWRAMGEWTMARFPGATGRLLRDRAQPTRFVSFGPWPDEETIRAWRIDPRFDETLRLLREHLDDFQPGTFDLVADSGA
jgi:heme-degrading monooxygenase HmoA